MADLQGELSWTAIRSAMECAALPEPPATMIAYRYKRGTHHAIKEEVPVPKPGPGEALLKVEAAGLCHSDVHCLNGSMFIPSTNFTMGHEGCGTLHYLGPPIDPTPSYTHISQAILEPGRRYAIYPLNPCFSHQCELCAAKRENLCPKRQPIGLNKDGSWAPWIVVPTRLLVPVPDSVESAEAAVATDAVVSPYHALKVRGQVGPNTTVLILGLGGLGTNAVQIAKNVLGAKRVLAADLKKESLDLALTLGADEVFDARTLVTDITERKIAVDVVVDFVGLKPTVKSAVSVVRFGGRVVLVGLGESTVELPLHLASAKELDIQMSFWGTQQDLEEVMFLIADGKIKPEVAVKPLEEVQAFVEKLEKGELKGRIALQPE